MIFFLGALPPPKGGVSIYCMRRLDELNGKCVPHIFFDSSRKLPFVKLVFSCLIMIFNKRNFEVEFNVSNPLSIFIFYILGLSKYTVFIDHNGSRRIIGSRFSKWVFNRFSIALKEIKVVNATLKNNYPNCRQKDIKVFSPFIKPTQRELDESAKTFPKDFTHLLRGDNPNIVLVTAWKPVNTQEEPDLYGLFDTLSIFKSVIKDYPDNNFVFMLGSLEDNDFCKSLLNEVDDLSNFDNFYFITGGVSQLPLMPYTKALIRLSKTDGDSISIREALFFGVRVIASDVITRPEGVTVCSVNNLLSVKSELIKILED